MQLNVEQHMNYFTDTKFTKTLLISALLYGTLVAYSLVMFLHVAGDKPYLPFMSISHGVKAVLFNCIFVFLHLILGLIAAFPIWLPILFKRKNGKILSVVNWLCMLALLTIVPLNSFLVSFFGASGKFNSTFFLLLSLMMCVIIFLCFLIFKNEMQRKNIGVL